MNPAMLTHAYVACLRRLHILGVSAVMNDAQHAACMLAVVMQVSCTRAWHARWSDPGCYKLCIGNSTCGAVVAHLLANTFNINGTYFPIASKRHVFWVAHT
jgi:hypothetical protein